MGSRKYYLQSAFSMPDEAKIRQEKTSLLNVKDSFKKLVIVNDTMNIRRDDDGITTMNIFERKQFGYVRDTNIILRLSK